MDFFFKLTFIKILLNLVFSKLFFWIGNTEMKYRASYCTDTISPTPSKTVLDTFGGRN